ncbi:hypothetical protein BD779DRAFT_1411989, partial [Infundibulicybe gibba]
RYLARFGKRKCFHVGGNSSCRAHIRQHFKEYKERCEAEDIPLNHHALPRPLYRSMKAEA